MEQVRFGIIGVGNQGSYYAKSLFDGGRVKDAVLTAICDVNPAKIESIKAKLENTTPAYFENYIDMLDSGLCDAILIEVPHYLHPEMAMECFKRNIHVISEKPAGVYTKQVREMNEASKNTSALFGMMFNQRTNCLYRKMREMIAAGEIGELQRVTWIITDWFRTKCYYDSGSWRATWDGEGGGVLINQSPHQLDLIQWIVGELPVAVNGFCQYGKWHDVEVEDEVTAYLRYKNGATGVFITTTGELPGTNRLEISGTGGKLLCEGGKLWMQKNPEDMTVIRDTCEKMSAKSGELVEVETDGENPQQLGIINNFAAAILGKEPLFVNGCDGIAGVELMNAIELSGWKNGATVTLPVDEEEYLAQLNAHRATSRTKVVDDSKVSDTSDTFGVGVKK